MRSREIQCVFLPGEIERCPVCRSKIVKIEGVGLICARCWKRGGTRRIEFRRGLPLARSTGRGSLFVSAPWLAEDTNVVEFG